MKLAPISFQNVVTAVATCISVVAVFFSWQLVKASWQQAEISSQQVEITRDHYRRSVTPILNVTPYAEGKGRRNGIYLSNDGLGPAIIKEFSVKSGSTVVSGFESEQWHDILTAADINPACFELGWPRADAAISASEKDHVLLSITKAEGHDICYPELIKLIGDQSIDISIQYESIYGEPKRVLASSKIKSKTVDALRRQIFGK
ncbi:MAG: hypothetical protein FWH15_04765 [Betaproteobacteria bacterium]|nr:hypothetical protein [Betaproteobacteria bacterium]